MEPNMPDLTFHTFHALRIKGFATVDTVAEIAVVSVDEAHLHLSDLQQRGLARFRETSSLWQLTPSGREHHAQQLLDDAATAQAVGALRRPYEQFVQINHTFKVLCGDWQLRDGKPNDHTDTDYDGAAIAMLATINDQVTPVVEAFGDALARLLPYSSRLTRCCQRLQAGETKMFTGVACGSYHDVWMELHEDLILSQGIDRAAEGSF